MPSIWVYAIAKNEEKHVDRFMDSVQDADGVVVLDTGSTDATVERLRERGATVHRAKIEPWDFAKARNMAYAKVPGAVDFCLCLDLDEVMQPGWRQAFDAAVDAYPECNRIRYRFVSRTLSDGTPDTVFMRDLCTRRHGFVWRNPIHEALLPTVQNITVVAEGMECRHYQDVEKSRHWYLDVMERAVDEDASDARRVFYLGREYISRGEREKGCETLKRYLAMPSAVWGTERAEAMRLIAFVEEDLRDKVEWCQKAMNEDPLRRDSYVDFALYACQNKEYLRAIWAAQSALAITPEMATSGYPTQAYVWGFWPHYLLALCYWNLGLQTLARQAITTAVQTGGDERVVASAREMGVAV